MSRKTPKHGTIVFRGGTRIEPPMPAHAIRDNKARRVVPDKSYERNYREYSVLECRYRSFLVQRGVDPADIPADPALLVAMVRRYNQ